MNYYIFPDAFFFNISGPDAERYLHSRMTNDIKNMPVNSALPSAILAPQGKVEGIVLVLRTAQETFLLIGDGGNSEKFQAALSRFIVADRVEITADKSLQLAWVEKTADEFKNSSEESFFQILQGNRGDMSGSNVIFAEENRAIFLEQMKLLGVKELTESNWNRERLLANFPQYGKEIDDTLLLPETGLLHLISNTKGCYVGQEVIEKISAIGKSPRIIARISVSGGVSFKKGATLISTTPEKKRIVGKIVSEEGGFDGDKTLYFAALKNDPELFTHLQEESTGASVSVLPQQ